MASFLAETGMEAPLCSLKGILVMFVGKSCESGASPLHCCSVYWTGDRSDMAPSLNTKKCEFIAVAQKYLASSIIDFRTKLQATVVAEGFYFVAQEVASSHSLSSLEST